MRLLPPNRELGWTPYVWLVYLGFFFVQPIVVGASWKEWLATALASGVFLVLYFMSYWLPARKRLWNVAAIALLGVGFAPFNSGSAVFIVYAAIGLAYVGDSGFAAKALVTLVTIVGLEALLLHLDPWFWVIGVGLSLALASVNIHFAQRSEANRRLRMAQDEIEHLARLAERERIARDLHDVLGHTLSVVILKSELASKLIGHDSERAGNEIRDVEQISREALAEVRHAIGGYRAGGLEGELARAASILKTAGIDAECTAAPMSLSAAQETALALAVREAVTNVVRHSGARRCLVKLEPRDGNCLLEIHDDGRGNWRGEGNGVRGMRERIEALGGTFRHETTGGTTLQILLPLTAQNRNGAA
jgi:two-component system, NarL family, sensor histidine kinase DesK